MLGSRKARRDYAPAANVHERIVAAAADLTCQYGWAWITMGKLADAVGVSRQVVHAEIGNKAELGEQMVARELALFLAEVAKGFEAHPTDVVRAIEAAAVNVFAFTERSALLQAIISVSYGGASELLPLLTSKSDLIQDTAQTLFLDLMRSYSVTCSPEALTWFADVLVRTAISYVVHPPEDTDAAVKAVAFLAEQCLIKVG